MGDIDELKRYCHYNHNIVRLPCFTEIFNIKFQQNHQFMCLYQNDIYFEHKMLYFFSLLE